jgi:hypothetical protein
MKANTSSNLNYYQVNQYLGIPNEIEIGSKEWYEAIEKAGYKFAYRFTNSDDNWMYFAKNNAKACEGAAELYAKEKSSDMKKARKYYYEYVDVFTVDYIIENWF